MFKIMNMVFEGYKCSYLNTSITFSFFFCSAFLLGTGAFLGGISFTFQYLQMLNTGNLITEVINEQQFTSDHRTIHMHMNF